jgi:hypothetical protein
MAGRLQRSRRHLCGGRRLSAVRQLVPLPLGSVRASFGAMSTLEDCYALVSAGCVTLKQAAVHLLSDYPWVLDVACIVAPQTGVVQAVFL